MRGLRRNDARFAALLCAVIVLVNAVIALSDRMAGLWNSTAEGINTSGEVVAEVVASTGVTSSQGDWAVHSVLWGVSALLLVLLVGRARHAVVGLAVFTATGLALEVLQNVLATERSAEPRDVLGNLLGLACGALVGATARRFVMAPGAKVRG